MKFQVFVSHASADKESFVRALATRLREFGLAVWYDEAVLRPGMSLRESVDAGLTQSEFCVLIISKTFLARSWTRWELNGILQMHLSTGMRRIIPVWHDVSADEVRQRSPSLADIVAI